MNVKWDTSYFIPFYTYDVHLTIIINAFKLIARAWLDNILIITN